MASESSYNIDTNTKTAFITLFFNGSSAGDFEFGNDKFTLLERVDPINATLSDFIRNLNLVDIWTSQISQLLSPTTSTTSPFQEETKKTAIKVEGKYVATETITLAEFDPSTQIITLNPRAEIELDFSDFRSWRDFLRRLSVICTNF